MSPNFLNNAGLNFRGVGKYFRSTADQRRSFDAEFNEIIKCDAEAR